MSSPSAGEFLTALRRRGAIVERRGFQLHVDAPKGVVTPESKKALETHKADLLARLEHEQRVLELSLDQFSHQDLAIEIRVDWLSETLWFVPCPRGLEALLARGVARGLIWTAGELKDLYRVPQLSSAEVRSLGRLKRDFGLEFLAVTTAEDFPLSPDSAGEDL